MPDTARRLSVFTESVIRGTTRLANQHGAINLDFQTFMHGVIGLAFAGPLRRTLPAIAL